MNFLFWTKIHKLKDKCLIKIVCVSTTFLIDFCPNKDKVVLHGIYNILIDLLSGTEISCHKNLKN